MLRIIGPTVGKDIQTHIRHDSLLPANGTEVDVDLLRLNLIAIGVLDLAPLLLFLQFLLMELLLFQEIGSEIHITIILTWWVLVEHFYF